MTLLFINHQDSFVYNLINWFHAKSNQKIEVIDSQKLKASRLKNLDGVVFSPGPGHAKDYPASLSFYADLPPTIPFLGVCLGYQIMLYAHGAKISRVQKIPLHGQQILLRKNSNSQFLSSQALQGYFVLYNSLGIEKNDPVFYDRFQLLATHKRISMAAEHRDKCHIGVQFHPESFASPNGRVILNDFLKLISTAQKAR